MAMGGMAMGGADMAMGGADMGMAMGGGAEMAMGGVAMGGFAGSSAQDIVNRFNYMDLNADGGVTADEAVAAAGVGGTMGEAYVRGAHSAMDLNGDGRVDAHESLTSQGWRRV